MPRGDHRSLENVRILSYTVNRRLLEADREGKIPRIYYTIWRDDGDTSDDFGKYYSETFDADGKDVEISNSGVHYRTSLKCQQITEGAIRIMGAIPFRVIPRDID